MKIKEKILLVKDKKDCCGCSACDNICPVNAITMQEDEYGFIYPKINDTTCIKCEACIRVCAYQNIEEKNSVIKTYAAVSQNTDLMKSTSGGVFASIATNIIKNNGIVFGAALESENGTLVPKHIMVDNEKDLLKLLGSKYVQSDIGRTFKEVRRQLLMNKQVLFCGTPCQIAGLKSFLKKEYDNLFLIDIVCHGVPNVRMFQDYLKLISKGNEVVDFKFRDKRLGWTKVGSISLKNKKNKIVNKVIRDDESSYYYNFSNVHTLRENCYSCKYACKHRPGDISIGDYWGIEKEHPEILDINNGPIDEKKGVSVVMTNTNKGEQFISTYSNLKLYISDYDKAAKVNDQLRRPSKLTKDRDAILNLYKDGGYEAVEKWFIKKERKNIFINKIKRKIPKKIKNNLKKVIKRGENNNEI